MRVQHPLPVLLLLLAAGSPLAAQTTQGTLQGRIRNQDNSPLAGVEIQLTSKALLQPRTARTVADGSWRVPLLPPGTYTVTARKGGFVTATRTCTLGLNDTAQLDFRMAAEASAIVEVQASANSAIKAEAGHSANYTAERLQTLPAQDRAFKGAADLSPGLVTGRSGDSFVIRGGKEYNTGYTVDGVNVKDPAEGRQKGTFFVEDAIQEVKVNLSPVHPRHGGTDGGTLEAVTKSGSNEFEGSLRLSLYRGAWNAATGSTGQKPTDDLSRTLTYTLGGPIVKDRLWFFASGRAVPMDSATNAITPLTGQMTKTPDLWTVWDPGSRDVGAAAIAAVLKAGPGPGFQITPFDSGNPYGAFYNQSTRTQFFQGKLKGAITADHLVEVTFSRDDRTYEHAFNGAFARLAQLDMDADQKVRAHTLGLNYTAILSPTTFLDATWNLYSTQIDRAEGDTSVNEVLGVGFGNSSVNSYGLLYPWRMAQHLDDKREIRSASANLKHFFQAAGSHELDFGVQYQDLGKMTTGQLGPNARSFQIGAATMINAAGTPMWAVLNRPLAGPDATRWSTAYNQQGSQGLTPVMTEQMGRDGYNHNKRTSLYLADTWTPNAQWVVMGGLRYDRYEVLDTTGKSLVKSGILTPRLSVKWDVQGNQSHVLQFTFARQAADFGSAFSARFIQSASAVQMSRMWTGNAQGGGLLANQEAYQDSTGWIYPGTYQMPGDSRDPLAGVRWVNFAQLTNPSNYGLVTGFSSVAKNMNVDPNLKAEHVDALTLGYTRAFESGAMLTLTTVYKRWANQWAWETSTDAAHMVKIDPAEFGAKGMKSFWGQVTNVFNTQDLQREYKSLELSWQAAPMGRFSWGGNYTYSQLKGNDQGGDVSGNTSGALVNYTPQAYYLQRGLLLSKGLTDDNFAPFGLLANNSQHRARLQFTFTQPLASGQVSYGFVVQYNAGNPQDLKVSAPSGLKVPATGPDGNPFRPTVNNPGYWHYFGQPGSWTNVDTYSTSFKASFFVPLGFKKLVVFGDMSLTNLFNTPQANNVDFQFGGTWSIGGFTQPNWLIQSTAGRPTSYTSGRTVGAVSLGLRF